MRYKIVIASDPLELAHEVNRLIGGGWTPQGGIGLSYARRAGQDEVEYAQAMIDPNGDSKYD